MKECELARIQHTIAEKPDTQVSFMNAVRFVRSLLVSCKRSTSVVFFSIVRFWLAPCFQTPVSSSKGCFHLVQNAAARDFLLVQAAAAREIHDCKEQEEATRQESQELPEQHIPAAGVAPATGGVSTTCATLKPGH